MRGCFGLVYAESSRGTVPRALVKDARVCVSASWGDVALTGGVK